MEGGGGGGGGGGGKKVGMWRKRGKQGMAGGKHGKRRHLVQYERHRMEEQRTGDLQKGGGVKTSTVKERGELGWNCTRKQRWGGKKE